MMVGIGLNATTIAWQDQGAEMNKLNASNAILTVSKINIILNQLLINVIDESVDEDEIKFYKRAVGNIMGEMCDRLLNPIFEKHPDLIPNELK
jgi:hypothetical protein